jgi:hypothetical protein
MKSLMILGCLLFAAALVLALAASSTAPSLRQIRRACGLHTGLLRVNALTDGRHENGRITFKADAAIATRHYLVKVGSDADHIAVIAAADDEPKGVCIDEPSAAEEPATVQLLGASGGTVLMVAGETITAGEDVYSGTNGTVQDLPVVAGTYWKVGRSVTASTVGVLIEVEPCLPQKVTIVANASTLAQTQAAMVGGAIVIVLGA